MHNIDDIEEAENSWRIESIMILTNPKRRPNNMKKAKSKSKKSKKKSPKYVAYRGAGGTCQMD